MRKWCVMDLISGADGKLVLTKLQAATFHGLLALTVAFITIYTKTFNEGMWALYAAVAVGHAVIDKTGSQISAFKRLKLEAEAPTPLVDSTTTTTTTQVKSSAE